MVCCWPGWPLKESDTSLNHPAIQDGPLTAAELADYNRQRNERAQCCNGDCNQGRQCVQINAASACSEELEDARRPMSKPETATVVIVYLLSAALSVAALRAMYLLVKTALQ